MLYFCYEVNRIYSDNRAARRLRDHPNRSRHSFTWRSVDFAHRHYTFRRFQTLQRIARIDGTYQSEDALATAQSARRNAVCGTSAFLEIPPRVEYHLTAKGQALGDVIGAIELFAQQHLSNLDVSSLDVSPPDFSLLTCEQTMPEKGTAKVTKSQSHHHSNDRKGV